LAQAANTASGPTPRDASDYLAKGSGQKKGSSQALGTSSSASKDFGSSPARRTKAATPTVTDTDAWPDVRMAAVGRAAKVIKDEEESVTSNAVSTQPSGKKGGNLCDCAYPPPLVRSLKLLLHPCSR
jgi:hypothetical protein